MSYKQAQAIYGIQGRSTVSTWLRKRGKMYWTQKPRKNTMHKTTKPKESSSQKIKRLENDLEDERLKNLSLNEVTRSITQTVDFNIAQAFTKTG